MSSEDHADRRRSGRIPIEMWVEESRGKELYFERSGNLSAGGLFLENTIPHPVGTQVSLQFTLPGDPAPIRVRAEIVTAGKGEELGMGLKFVELDPKIEARIAALIHARK